MVNEDRRLPVIDDCSDEEAPVCSPTNYVSNEEAALFASMRRLREQSVVEPTSPGSGEFETGPWALSMP